jgi:hypothetical protein
MAKYRKKPVVIEAIQNKGKHENHRKEMMEFMGLDSKSFRQCADASVLIETLEGIMKCDYLDWIIKGINGEFYPCKPDIFQKTYEAVND